MDQTPDGASGVGSPSPAAEAAARRIEAAALEIAAVVRRRERTALATLHRARCSDVGELRLGIDQRLALAVGGGRSVTGSPTSASGRR